MSLESRFFDKTRINGNCLEWTGANNNGYGQIWVENKLKKATHVAIYLSTGRWPPADKIVCHHCDNKKCVAVEHLYIGTQVENQRDTYNRGPTPVPKMIAAWKSRTQCHHGHLYPPDCKLDYRGARICYECQLSRTRRQNEKRKIERKALKDTP